MFITHIDLKKDSINHIDIPQYEGLAVKDKLNFLVGNPLIGQYFPEGKELLKLPRDWIANVANTVVGKPFEKWVK